MNFYNPYFYSIPPSSTTGLLSKINFSSIISGTTKTLNLVNQAIPIFKQVSPIIKNAKTMFAVMNEFKKSAPENVSNASSTALPESNIIVDNQNNSYPTFFI